MADKPIIFSAPMVRALLDGRKTQTRRVLKPQPMAGGYYDGSLRMEQVYPPDAADPDCYARFSADAVGGGAITEETMKLRYAHGDRLYVREGWNVSHKSDLAPGEAIERTFDECVSANRGFAVAACDGVVYRATGAQYHQTFGKARWRSPIHMPRWASRLTLIVTDVRVQRLQDISEADAVAEGVDAVTLADVPRQAAMSRRSDFAGLWNSLHGPDAWAANPWVCALTFTVHKCNIDKMPKEVTANA